MRTYRKVLLFALPLLLATTVLSTGCQNQGGEEGAEQEQAEPTAAEQEQAEPTEDGQQEAAGEQADQADQQTETHEGTIREVNPDEREIYVVSNGRVLELYFIDETELTRNGEPVEFSELEQQQKVRVEVRKSGDSLDPLKVEILE